MFICKDVHLLETVCCTMNKFAFRTTGLLIKALYNLSRATFHIHGQENIPNGPIIFVVNHFTRLETFLFPYVVYTLTKTPVWSLAAADLFRGSFGEYLEKVGAVSNRAPNRDQLIVKSLLSGEAHWIIFPEGRMVKNKKIVERGKYIISYAGGKHPPHTGAATLALRTEFYRRRILELAASNHEEARRLLGLFQLDGVEGVSGMSTWIVPVNISYYPLRARENILSKMAVSLVGNIPERVIEELMTEGSMLLSGVDIDIRFGSPIDIRPSLERDSIRQDVQTRTPFNFDDDIASRKQMRREALRIMHEYMSAIYGMTTVNHDHLFASVLRRMPRRSMDEMDLRRRVFLVAMGEFKKKPIYKHRSLEDNQIPLITDDRFGKFRDFLDLAIEKGVLSREGERLFKNPFKRSAILDFNRIRIENPIAVMANDVEPLAELQGLIRRIALKPSWWIRKNVATILQKQEVSAFKADYHRFFRSGESKSESVGMPFLVKGGPGGKTGVLLVHGYMAAPAEVRQLAEYLCRQGFWVYAVRLAGHGTAPEDLSERSWQDWALSVETGYGILSSLCRRVIVGGFSAGGGLALEMATRISRISGVFAVCPPVRLRNPLSRLAPGMDTLRKSLEKMKMRGIMKNYIENHPENPGINYLRNPISGVHQLERLMEGLLDRLQLIKIPALVIQSKGDPVVDPHGSKELFEKIGTTEKDYRLFDFDRHGILLGEGSETVHSAIGEFCKQAYKSPPTAR